MWERVDAAVTSEAGSGGWVRVQGVPVAGDYPARAPEASRGQAMRITVVGEEILHRRCRTATVELGTPELSQLIDDMFCTMYVADGVGLAANQVGVDLRLFVYDCEDDAGVRHVGHLLNPVVEEAPPSQRRLVDEEEGCLSVPGASAALARPDRAVVRGVDQTGAPLVIEGTGYFARCLLHESDHLDGLLYVDRLGRRARRGALEEMAERQEAVYARRAARAQQLGAVVKDAGALPGTSTPGGAPGGMT